MCTLLWGHSVLWHHSQNSNEYTPLIDIFYKCTSYFVNFFCWQNPVRIGMDQESGTQLLPFSMPSGVMMSVYIYKWLTLCEGLRSYTTFQCGKCGQTKKTVGGIHATFLSFSVLAGCTNIASRWSRRIHYVVCVCVCVWEREREREKERQRERKRQK